MEATDASRLVCVVVVSYQEYSLTHARKHSRLLCKEERSACLTALAPVPTLHENHRFRRQNCRPAEGRTAKGRQLRCAIKPFLSPNGSQLNYTVAAQLLPEVRRALEVLHAKLAPIPGVQIEDNKFVASVHTRNVSAADLPAVDAVVNGLLEEQPLLTRTAGIHVIEGTGTLHSTRNPRRGVPGGPDCGRRRPILLRKN